MSKVLQILRLLANVCLTIVHAIPSRIHYPGNYDINPLLRKGGMYPGFEKKKKTFGWFSPQATSGRLPRTAHRAALRGVAGGRGRRQLARRPGGGSAASPAGDSSVVRRCGALLKMTENMERP